MTELKNLTKPSLFPNGEKLLQTPRKKTRDFVAYSPGENSEADYVKICSFGHPGVGKTRAIKGFLEHGLRIASITTDVGGSGIRTVELELKREGRGELLKNLKEIELREYEEVCAFLEDPSVFRVQLENSLGDLYDWNPNLLVWEGFSNWQGNDLANYVLSFKPATDESKTSELRIEGLKLEPHDWDGVKRGTNLWLNKFLRLYNKKTGQAWHKYVTIHENQPSEVRLGKGKQGNEEGVIIPESDKEPMVSGSARKNIGAGFDLVLRMVKESGRRGEDVYWYETNVPHVAVKSRGFKLDAREEADMYKLWAKLMGQLGWPSGEL